jgi:kynureninase
MTQPSPSLLDVQFAEEARQFDAADPLAPLRAEFLRPVAQDGKPILHFAGHSLGLQPRQVRESVLEVLDDWANLGVEGHFAAKRPWLSYHELLTESTARLVGALPQEVVVMNTLSVNVHLMMVSFYRPTAKRFRILIEGGAFPSDRYAVASQAQFHGFDPALAVQELTPRPGEATLRDEDILATIARDGEHIALILLGNCNYLTGQAFDMAAITRAGHAQGCHVGFDLAHGAGNLVLNLHDDGPDFAVWCNYKYLNAGPGGLGGAFVHERHLNRDDIPRFSGWWGHDKASRFDMGPHFKGIPTAEAWQLSNPPILALAALRASMALFDAAGMPALRQKAAWLTDFLHRQLVALPLGVLEVLTPPESQRRGTMLTLRVAGKAAELVSYLQEHGAEVDLRRPDIVRIAPVPLYTSARDVAELGVLLRAFWEQNA